MTDREAVQAERPDAVAVWVTAEAHAAEANERWSHWEVRGGEVGPLLGAGDSEQEAWASAAGRPAPRRWRDPAARREMGERVGRHAAAGPEQIARRLGELALEPDSPAALE